MRPYPWLAPEKAPEYVTFRHIDGTFTATVRKAAPIYRVYLRTGYWRAVASTSGRLPVTHIAAHRAGSSEPPVLAKAA